MTVESNQIEREMPAASLWAEDLLRLVDVGGAGGLQPKWLAHSRRVAPILFEPNPVEAAKLRELLRHSFSSAVVVESALSNVVQTRSLNLTRHWGCSSLLRPNEDVLAQYRIAPLFEIVGTAAVPCTRYDILHQQRKVPQVDAIKIDVQGFEFEVLQGFGALLQNCLGIELETHLYPIYRGQKLLHDLVAFLSDFGFVLRKISPIRSFDGNIVELDVWFTKDILAWRTLSQGEREKFALICDVWDLVDYVRVDPCAPHNHLLEVRV